MTNDRRRELLSIMSRIEQLIAAAEEIMAGDTDDEIVLRTSELLAEHRCMLAEVQRKLTKMDSLEQRRLVIQC